MLCARHQHPVTDWSDSAPRLRCSAVQAGAAESGLAPPRQPFTLPGVIPSSPDPADGAAPPAPRNPATPAGDYGSFFKATFAPLRRYIARLVGSREEAQDIAQDAFRKVYTAMRDRPVANPQALLYTTARHLAIDELKHRSRSPFQAAPAPESALSGAPAVESVVMAREELDLLEAAINRLPDECREIVTLRTVEQLTHEQVGARLGLTRKQAEKRLHRAMRLLHAALNPAAAGSVAYLPPRESDGNAAR